MTTDAAPALRLTHHMYRGYRVNDTPVEREPHDPAQWREQRSRAECQDEMPLQSICGYMQRRFLCDQQEQKII